MRVRLLLSAVAAAALCALAACQPLPRPFAPDESAQANPLLLLKDRGGVVVLDVDGAPAAVTHALPEATVAALHALNIPASTRSANRKSRFLYAQTETSTPDEGRVEVKLTWDLVGPDGRSIGRHVVTGTVSAESWNNGGRELVRRLAEASARGIAPFVQAPRPRDAPRVATLRPLYVMPVTGVDGDRGGVLRRAMTDSLRRLELAVAPVRRKDSLAVFGKVSLGPATAGQRRIEIAWSVREPGKPELGNLKQANIVPVEALGPKWADLAKVIAEAAAPAIVEVLRRGEGNSEARR